MRSSDSLNQRKQRSKHGSFLNNLASLKRHQEENARVGTVGRVLRDNAGLLAAIIALIGVIITQLVTVNVAGEGFEAQRKLEAERARGADLQKYVNDMGTMILDTTNPLPEAEPGEPVSNLARVKTLTVLEGLDGQRRRIVLQFLDESKLIRKEGPVVALSGADLLYAHLSSSDLRDADLQKAELRGADLQGSYLQGADLRGTDLREAKLQGANLQDADLREAELQGAEGITSDELERYTTLLEGTRMPDGSIHR